jgi:hypothetical protein
MERSLTFPLDFQDGIYHSGEDPGMNKFSKRADPTEVHKKV